MRDHSRQSPGFLAPPYAPNLRAEPWTAATLRPFFGSKPIKDWFNASSSRVKSGEVKPAELSPQVALAMMIDDPLLIR